MPRPACVPCGRFMRCDRNDVTVIEGMPDDGNWIGYKAWSADRWKCPGCGAEIIAGWGHGPLAERYQEDFAAYQARADHTINDC